MVSRLAKALGSVTEDYAILIVDDGSKDETWSELQRMAKSDPRVGGLRFSRNFGQHAAIMACVFC